MALRPRVVVCLAVAAALLLPVLGYALLRARTDPARFTAEAKARLDAWVGDGADLDAAESRLERVRWTHPYYAPAWAQRSRLERDRGYLNGYRWDPNRLGRALACANRAISLDPQLYDGPLAAGYAYYSFGDERDARFLVRACQRLDPRNPEGTLLAAQIEAWDAHWPAACALADSVLARRPAVRLATRALQVRIDASEQLGDSTAAESCYRAQIALDPGDAWVRGNFAGFLCARGRYEEAVDWATQALARLDYGVGHNTLAHAYCGLGDQVMAAANGSWREAAQDYDQATRSDPTYALGWLGLARSLRAGYDQNPDPKLLEASTRAAEGALELDSDLAGARELLFKDQTAKAKAAGS